MDLHETFENLLRRELEIFKRNPDTFGYPNELYDMELNDITCDMIITYARIHNNQKCYLGKVNRYSEDKGKPYLVPYEGQQVFNFEYGFVIPCYDEKLVEMIQERECAEYTGMAEDYKRVSAIMDRIMELKGINLFWV